MKLFAIDLYCGLGGWTQALLDCGYEVVGFDIERHDYGTGGYPGQLVLQDTRTIHGAQLRDAALIVASPPCQEFSYRAMPWKRAKALGPPVLGINLFWQCWRIKEEACEAKGEYIPMVVENVCGAEKWVGGARWHYGSYYLWGDVPAIMPFTSSAQKVNQDGTNHGQGSWFKIADSVNRGARGQKNAGGSWLTSQRENDARKGMRCGAGAQYGGPLDPRRFRGGSVSRKAASAQIAKIPYPLARHIAHVYRPGPAFLTERPDKPDVEPTGGVAD
jgi:hypothetical protein